MKSRRDPRVAPPRPSAERQRQLAELADWHREWASRHEGDAAGSFAPDGRGADYNQHNVDLDVSSAAEDEFHARARQIMGVNRPGGKS
jgi:hypothetical protein